MDRVGPRQLRPLLLPLAFLANGTHLHLHLHLNLGLPSLGSNSIHEMPPKRPAPNVFGDDDLAKSSPSAPKRPKT